LLSFQWLAIAEASDINPPSQFGVPSPCHPATICDTTTRVGSGTKIVFTGDPYQIDNPYVDSSSNGFNCVVSHFRSEAIAAHIELQNGERSEPAGLAANIL
jgi:PhoH-like ATPase